MGLAVATVSCEPERVAHTTLTTVVRLTDLVPLAERPGIRRVVDFSLGGETRQVMAAPASSPLLARLETGKGIRYYRLEIPASMRAWGRAAIDRPIFINGKKLPQWPNMVDLTKDPPPTLMVSPAEKPEPSMILEGHAAPNPEAFDVETRPFVVPEGALLDFGVGVYAPGMRERGTVEAGITVREGMERTDVWRADLGAAHLGWRNERADLGRFAGRTVQLYFWSRRPTLQQAGLLAIFAEPRVLARRHTPARPVNVVLISMDTLRAQSVGAYGGERATTPTLDRLAREGTLFEDAYSTATYTLPGHMSMFTGLGLGSHGAVTLVTPIALGRRTISDLLQGAGYSTALVSSNSWLTPWLGFRRGIDAYVEHQSPFAPPAHGLPCEAFTSGLQWLRAHRDEPVFLFLHNYQVHRPYVAPPPYVTLFGVPPPLGPVEGDSLLYRYEQEVRYADDQLRAFLEELEALGLADRTLVVVTADHGEAFGEHGHFEHTRDAHDEMARVPLVMRLPGAIPADRRVTEPVSLVDILPTVLDVVGLPPHDGTEGMSLLPLATGTAGRLPREGVFTEAGSQGVFDWFDLTAIRSRTHSCIYNARVGTTECFDRRIDPWERLAPLAPDDATPQARSARAALARFVAARPPLVPRWTPDHTAPTDVMPPRPVDHPERVEQLRALGYLE